MQCNAYTKGVKLVFLILQTTNGCDGDVTATITDTTRFGHVWPDPTLTRGALHRSLGLND